MPTLCQALFFSKQLERQQIGWLPAIWVSPTAPGMFWGWVHRGKWSPFSAALGLMGNILHLPVRPSQPCLLWDLGTQFLLGSARGQISGLIYLRFLKHP